MKKLNKNERRRIRYSCDASYRQISINKAIAWQRNNPEKYLIRSARHRAKKGKIPFNLTFEDIIIPEYCPVLGIKLERNEKQKNSSPSLDRIFPELGYVRGNVRVISWRANNLKRDASVVELKAILNDLEKRDTVLIP